MSPAQLNRIRRARFWARLGFVREWSVTGSLWSDDWEAGEREALREAFGVTDRLERAPSVADDADLVWQPAPNALGYRGCHVSLWHPELRAAGYGRYAERAR